jgi:isoleucyl-tRNA synthetase
LAHFSEPDFEMRQMRLFQRMVQQGENRLSMTLTTGHVTYRLRPTYYSPSSRTALAESELKYEDGHKSRSVYVGFDVEKADMSDGLREAYDQAVTKAGELPLRLAVWTTTAWTLPANLVSRLAS